MERHHLLHSVFLRLCHHVPHIYLLQQLLQLNSINLFLKKTLNYEKEVLQKHNCVYGVSIAIKNRCNWR